MLSRRISSHIKAQNWLGVGLDFLIVVVGVFLGLQVSNWNAARADVERANDLIERLEADFTLLSEELAFGVDRIRTFARAGDEVYEILIEARTPKDSDEFGRLLNAAGSSHPPTAGSPTYTEMLSTGDIRLIDNQDLRAALVEYHQLSEQSTRIFELLLPSILRATEATDPFIQRSRVDAKTGFPIVVSYDLVALGAHASHFQTQARSNNNLLALYERQFDLARNVLDALGAD